MLPGHENRMMKRFIAGFTLTAFAGLSLTWGACHYKKKIFMDPEMAVHNAHTEIEKKCDVGKLTILGDSTGIADYLPEEIGPDVRTLAVGGGSPLESFFIMKHIVNTCSSLPKAVILSFTPFKLGAGAQDMALLMWARSVPWNIISWQDTKEILHIARESKDTQLFGSKSLFDIDARLKIFLYTHNFPTFYFPSFLGYFQEDVIRHDASARKNKYKHLYNDALADDGHVSYGQSVESHYPDLESKMHGYSITPEDDQYLKRIADLSKEHGIHVYFVAPPRNAEFVPLYAADMVQKYVDYIKSGEKAGEWHVLGEPFREIPASAVGDDSHLNAHGEYWFSRDIRRALLSTPDATLAWTDQAIAPMNIYEKSEASVANWKVIEQRGRLQNMFIASDTIPPRMAYQMNGPVVSLSIAQPELEHSQNVFSIQSDPSPILKQDSYYVGSIFVKNDKAQSATWRLLFPGGFDGAITWDFVQQEAHWNGEANPLNSGVEECAGGWMRLWVRGKTRPFGADYENSAFSFSSSDVAAVKIYGASFENNFNTRNDCAIE